MKTFSNILTIVACIATPAASRADTHLSSDAGVSMIGGGGVVGFTDKTMRQVMSSSVGALWDVRLTIGSHMPFAVDISYLGTDATIHGFTNTQSASLLGTTFEAALRYNLFPHRAWNPYAFVGLGWQRYDIGGGSFALADTGMNKTDNSAVFPMGLGISYRAAGFVVDFRSTFRISQDYGLVLEDMTSTSYAPLHTWETDAAIGYEF